jgi:hypothetical protein
MAPLKAEGFTDIELLAVTAAGVTWDHHAPGYDQVPFPVVPDTAGVYYLYGATYYDFFFVDKQGRLAGKLSDFSDKDVAQAAKKVKELHAQ